MLGEKPATISSRGGSRQPIGLHQERSRRPYGYEPNSEKVWLRFRARSITASNDATPGAPSISMKNTARSA